MMNTDVSPSPSPSSPRRHRILVVDDNVESCRALAKYLEVSGFEVGIATDGTSALAALDASPPPDFVLTDLMLPDLDGREVAHRARQLSPPPMIALITGWAVDEVPQGKSPDFDWVFPKPLNIRDLVAKIRGAAPA